MTATFAVGATIAVLSCSRDQTTRTPAKAADTPTQPVLRALTTPEAEHAKTFTEIAGVRGAAPTYDVIDAQGRVVQHVVLPVLTRLVGFGRNGAIYVVRLDDDDLENLQRYRLN